jgi:hypothetical protein
MAGVASGLLTYAIINLDGHWGHPGWSWVFLVCLHITGTTYSEMKRTRFKLATYS